MSDPGPQPDDTQPFIAPGPPPPPPPPTFAPPLPSQPPVPYGGPAYSADYGVGWHPAYGPPVVGRLTHQGATAALVLGIIAVASLVLTPFCCITLPGVLCAPFAWVIGGRARRDIDTTPSVYANRGSAQAGWLMGVIVSVLGTVVILLFVGLVIFFNATDYSLV